MTTPSSKFPVYWTDDDIDSKVQDITNDVAKRLGKAGIAKYFGFISETAANVCVGTHSTCFGLATGVVSAVTSLVGHYVYYQHLLSARSARDELVKDDGGSISDFGKINSTYTDSARKMARSILPW